jgi:nucleoside-diphosphate-sugar epimerase
MTLRAMHEIARRKSGGSRWHVVLPLGVLRWIPPAIDRLRLTRFSPPTFTSDALFTLGSRLEVDTTRARTALGFEPRSVAQSVSDAIDWWRERGDLA